MSYKRIKLKYLIGRNFFLVNGRLLAECADECCENIASLAGFPSWSVVNLISWCLVTILCCHLLISLAVWLSSQQASRFPATCLCAWSLQHVGWVCCSWCLVCGKRFVQYLIWKTLCALPDGILNCLEQHLFTFHCLLLYAQRFCAPRHRPNFSEDSGGKLVEAFVVITSQIIKNPQYAHFPFRTIPIYKAMKYSNLRLQIFSYVLVFKSVFDHLRELKNSPRSKKGIYTYIYP